MSAAVRPGARVGILRRSFLKGLGLGIGGLALGVFEWDAAEAGTKGAGGRAELRPNVFVHLSSDGIVTIVCSRSEMGQGVRSSLPALMADELGADPRKMKIVQADGDVVYGNQNTDGSSSVRGVYEKLRLSGATARAMLIAAAAQRWHVPAAECEARDHFVFHPKSHRKLGFGALVAAASKLPVPEPDQVSLRPKAELRHVGKEGMPVVDAPDLVRGRTVFGADVRIPGMLTAVVARPPVAGGKIAKWDGARARAIPGVKKVLELPGPTLPFGFQPLGGVAVVAENTWAAMRGRAALDLTWAAGENGSYNSDPYREGLTRAVRAAGRAVREKGDADKALSQADRRVEAEYFVPHLAHATMEPPSAVALFRDGRCEAWACTQNPQAARKQVAGVLGIEQAKVTIHVTLLGGGFGRKSKPDYVAEAAWLSREVGAPVRVQWLREDDLQHDYYHTTSAQRLEAGLDKQGNVTAWLHRTAFPSISSIFENGVTHANDGELGQGVTDLPLAVPNFRAENGEAAARVRIGWLRSVCNIHHAFAIGSFFDEIAHARGADPRDSLLNLLGPARKVSAADLGVAKVGNYNATLEEHPIDVGRFRGVVERVTELSGWASRKRSGRAMGLAVHRSFLSYVAAVLSVVRDPGGKIRVDEAWVVADAGILVNPERVRAQMEGAVIFGMSLAFYGAITMRDGAVEQTNFRDYRLLRIPEAPRRIHVDLVESEGPPGGVGEPGVPPIAPALANAVFAATGQRVRELPLAKAGLV